MVSKQILLMHSGKRRMEVADSLMCYSRGTVPGWSRARQGYWGGVCASRAWDDSLSLLSLQLYSVCTVCTG